MLRRQIWLFSAFLTYICHNTVFHMADPSSNPGSDFTYSSRTEAPFLFFKRCAKVDVKKLRFFPAVPKNCEPLDTPSTVL